MMSMPRWAHNSHCHEMPGTQKAAAPHQAVTHGLYCDHRAKLCRSCWFGPFAFCKSSVMKIWLLLQLHLKPPY